MRMGDVVGVANGCEKINWGKRVRGMVEDGGLRAVLHSESDSERWEACVNYRCTRWWMGVGTDNEWKGRAERTDI